MRLLYTLSILLFGLLARFTAPFNSKSRKWVSGRKNWRKKLATGSDNLNRPIWIHCSSLGEFEQGRPVIEALKDKGQHVVLSFFSPSGYENLKDYKHADFVTYLPLDTAKNARDFLDILEPKAVIFIKYEFWFNFMRAIDEKNIPMYLISGIFRKEQHFFQWYGSWFARQLRRYNHLFVQNDSSAALLNSLEIDKVTVSGDNRFDRVLKIAAQPKDLIELKDWAEGKRIMVCGSTWTADEEIIHHLFQRATDWNFIIAPHEVDAGHIDQLVKLFGNDAVTWTELQQSKTAKRVLIIDAIGLLSSAYRFADLAYIGGGFGKGIHNTLEAAVFGAPIIFGPNFSKFSEAIAMVDRGSAFPVKDEKGLLERFHWLNEGSSISEIGNSNAEFVRANAGATEKIIKSLEEGQVLA